MWYRQAAARVNTWEDFADSLAKIAEEDVSRRIHGAHLPNQGAKLANELRDLFIERLSEGRNLRSIPAQNPEAYDSLRNQVEIYAMLTYRGIAGQISGRLSDAITDDSSVTAQKKADVLKEIGKQVREATLGLKTYLERGPKFKILDDDDGGIHKKVKRLPS